MKQCPQCRQTFADDNHFCLSDGTPLKFFDDSPEEMTVVKPFISEELTVIRPIKEAQVPPQVVRQGVSPVFAYLTVGLLLILLGGGAILLAFFIINKLRGTTNDVEISQKSNSTFNNQNLNKKDNSQNKIVDQNENLRQQKDEIEKEKQRLAEERKKLMEEKTKPLETPPPLPTPSINFPPQPTSRIKFGRGRIAESISGKVFKERSFVLESRNGQYLSANVVGGGNCVTFSNGSNSIGFVTSSGDNRLTVVNACNTEASFSLTVSIK
ncbi:MAG TPA: hypothetical protein PKY82_19170 [Pyrinomonadaceae bacterium]|nr:hypothetical protein [Pyrinomonadaceae bacterium]